MNASTPAAIRVAHQNRSGPGAAASACGRSVGRFMDALTPSSTATPANEQERLAYSVQEAADLLGVNYFSVYRLIQRNKLRACRALRGKLLVPRSELVRLLKS